MNTDQQFWAVVPAAGVGKRMDNNTPKQYLPLGMRRVIEHTLQRLLDSSRVCGVIVALGEQDEYWPEMQLSLNGKPCLKVTGGAERRDSVLNALKQLLEDDIVPEVNRDDFVLVHDAVRPCIRESDIQKLVEVCSTEGAILAVPVRDTLKSGNEAGSIKTSVPREGLWQAQTPQMFPLGQLYGALQKAANDGAVVTDESGAMEHIGFHPKLVHGSEDNIKITRPEDLKLAGLYLESQRQESQT